MAGLNNTTLVLFFTEGVSLHSWWQDGLFEREVALYRALLPHFQGITFVTCGDRRDLGYSSRIDGINIVCNRFGLPGRIYSAWLRHVYGRLLRNRQVLLKTNQSLGGQIALDVAGVARAPLVARGGYLLSDFIRRRYGDDSPQLDHATRLEQGLFNSAARIVVTTESAADEIRERYAVSKNKLRVIPNYVDTTRFRPLGLANHTNPLRLCSIGRLEEQKNPLAIVEALAGLDMELVVVGTGPLQNAMRELAQKLAVKIEFKGRLPHEELPEVLNSCDIYILASHYEGHPKTLLEAMSCGLPVLGAACPGIRELIRHEETGLLADPDAASLKQGLRRLMADAALRRHLGANARAFIEQTVSLKRIVEQELALYAEVLNGAAAPRAEIETVKS